MVLLLLLGLDYRSKKRLGEAVTLERLLHSTLIGSLSRKLCDDK